MTVSCISDSSLSWNVRFFYSDWLWPSGVLRQWQRNERGDKEAMMLLDSIRAPPDWVDGKEKMIYHQNGYSLLPLLSSYQYYLQNNCPSPFRNIFLIWPLQQLQQSMFWCADLLKSAHKTGKLKLFFISDLNHGFNVWSKLWRQQQEWLEERMRDSRTDYLLMLTMSNTALSGHRSQLIIRQWSMSPGQ